MCDASFLWKTEASIFPAGKTIQYRINMFEGVVHLINIFCVEIFNFSLTCVEMLHPFLWIIIISWILLFFCV